MSATTTTTLILSSVGDYGVALIAILTAVIGIGLAMLVFRFGWSAILVSASEGGVLDRSQAIHDFAMGERQKRGDFDYLESEDDLQYQSIKSSKFTSKQNWSSVERDNL